MGLFSKNKDTLNTRIQRLRKEKGLTQVELAAKLNITDKAVSKWESGDGNPDISLLPVLAEIFGVTTDYLLTGKQPGEKIVTISRMELCAKNDDVAMVKEFVNGHKIDENNKCLLEYIYQYESTKIFKEYGATVFLGPRGIFSNHDVSEFMYMAIVSNALEQFSKDPYFVQRGIKDFKVLGADYYTDKAIKALMTDKRVSKETRDAIVPPLDKKPWEAPLDWQQIDMKIVTWLVKNGDDKETEDFLDYVDAINRKSMSDLERNKNDSRGQGAFIPVDSYKQQQSYIGTYGNNYTFPIIAIGVNVIEGCVNDKRINIAKKLNEINKVTHRDIFDEHRLHVEEIKNMEGTKKEDVDKALVLFDGIVDIEALIKLGDFDFYDFMIHEYPASEFERAYIAYLKKDYKTVLKFGMKYCRNIVEAIQTNDDEKLKNAFDAIIRHSVRTEKYFVKDDDTLKAIFKDQKAINYSYFVERGRLNSCNKYDVGHAVSPEEFISKKYVVYLDSIVDVADPRFFKEAVKGDKSQIDTVLEEIVSKHPDRYVIQKILLDAGAMLHHRWVENPGDEYESSHDEADAVSTQLLKNQIEVLMKKEK